MSEATEPAPRFGVLGPLRAWRGDGEVDLGPVQQRVVLAVLLLQAGHPISRQRLISAVWGDAPPARSVNLIQRHVSRLRRVLGTGEAGEDRLDAPFRLVWTDAGYLLTVRPARSTSACSSMSWAGPGPVAARDGAAREDPGTRPGRPLPAQLPHRIPDFTGRDAELGRLDAW